MSDCIYDNPEVLVQMRDMRSVTPAKRDGAVQRVANIYDGAEEDFTQNQRDSQPQQSCYSRRSFLAVSLSLSLLCHLLLAIIITLGLSSLKLHQENTNVVQKHQHLYRERLELGHFCKDGYISHNESFYYISTEAKTWEVSRQDCRNRGADLIIINSKEEQWTVFYAQDFVSSLKQYYWIGLSETDEEGKWKWVDGSILTNAAELGVSWDPPVSHKAKNCFITYLYWSTHNWENYDCHKYSKWICEKNTNV